MNKKAKFDESGDSDELQALFDSIAGGPAEAPPAAKIESASGDSDDLQALFDEVSAEFSGAFEPAPQAAPAAPVASVAAAETVPEAIFTRIGQMTRQVHNTLRELGFDSALREVADAIPDARQRLTYIAQMTEQAASRVLNATDVAKPIQDRLHSDAQSLSGRWDKLFANQLSVDEFKALAGETRDFVAEVGKGTEDTNAQLLEIMMAQDFQDLTGQVIKKVVEMAQQLESELLQVLLEVTPADKRTEKYTGLMNGPVVSAEGREDVVSSQAQVDDLLESLGF